jgi:hypothetical protein
MEIEVLNDPSIHMIFLCVMGFIKAQQIDITHLDESMRQAIIEHIRGHHDNLCSLAYILAIPGGNFSSPDFHREFSTMHLNSKDLCTYHHNTCQLSHQYCNRVQQSAEKPRSPSRQERS